MSNDDLKDDLWERAAACVQAAYATTDPKRRALLAYLGNFWISLVEMDPTEIDEAAARNIAAIAEMQAELIASRPTFH
jgi:hypothetical protein